MKYTVDAKDRTLGRVAAEAAKFILGKSSPAFQKNKVSDSIVEVVNVGKMKISDKKLSMKNYISFSGYPGGQKIIPMKLVIEKHGIGEVLRRSVLKMLPKNKLQAKRIKFLKIQE